MMKLFLQVALSLVFITWAMASSGDDALLLVEPATDASGRPQMQAAPDGRMLPVVVPASETEFTAALRAALSVGFGAEVLRLQQNINERYQLDNPVWLMLSLEDGGYARHGFYLKERGELILHDVWYVDMLVDRDSLASGQFEEIWSHETAHVLLAMVMPHLPRIANTMHQSMALTDDVVAFDEGLAIAMQPLARQRTANDSLRETDLGVRSNGYTEYWLSRQDQQLRHYGVKQNLFVHPVLEPPGGVTLFERYRRTQSSTAINRYQLRSATQLLASEGYVATVFYRLLQQTEIALSVRQEMPQHDDYSDWQLVFMRLLSVLKNSELQAGNGDLTAQVFESWRNLYPQDWPVIVDAVLNTSFGVTADNDAHLHFASVADSGLQGDMQTLVSQLPAARAWLAQLRTEILSGEKTLFGAAGAPLWVENPAFAVGRALWATQRDQPLRINLNTATDVELETLPSIDAATAAKITTLRRRDGDYQSIDDLCRRADISAVVCEELSEMQYQRTTYEAR